MGMCVGQLKRYCSLYSCNWFVAGWCNRSHAVGMVANMGRIHIGLDVFRADNGMNCVGVGLSKWLLCRRRTSNTMGT